MKIIIIGGGIGGLTAAAALHPKHEVRVYEKSASFKPLGTGIGIGGNALQALFEIGLGEQVSYYGNPLSVQHFCDEKGKTLNKIEFSTLTERYGQENMTIHRGILHQILHDSLPENIISFGKTCIDAVQQDGKATAFFSDGTSDEADMLIAADGISSPIRQKLMPGRHPVYAGYTCWRGIAPNEGLVKQDTSCEIWSPQGRFGYAPLSGGQLYWFACVNAERHDKRYLSCRQEEVAGLFSRFPSEVRKMIKATPDEAFLHHDLSDIKPLSQFVFGRIVLLGDAAHATTPNMGQGAGQAIEDAVVLAGLIEQSGLEQALVRYEKIRIPHTRKVIRLSRSIGWVAQWTSPLSVRLRNAVFSLSPPSLMLWSLKFLFERPLPKKK